MSELAARRGPRRHVLDQLVLPLSRLKWIKGRWTVRGTVYEVAGQQRRPRRPDEYPENQEQAWSDLYHQADAGAAELIRLRDYAYARLTELRGREAGA